MEYVCFFHRQSESYGRVTCSQTGKMANDGVDELSGYNGWYTREIYHSTACTCLLQYSYAGSCADRGSGFNTSSRADTEQSWVLQNKRLVLHALRPSIQHLYAYMSTGAYPMWCQIARHTLWQSVWDLSSTAFTSSSPHAFLGYGWVVSACCWQCSLSDNLHTAVAADVQLPMSSLQPVGGLQSGQASYNEHTGRAVTRCTIAAWW